MRSLRRRPVGSLGSRCPQAWGSRTFAILLLCGALAMSGVACGPRPGRGPQISTGVEAPLRPLAAKEAASLAKRFSERSLVCFESIFKESLGKAMEALDRADPDRRRRASKVLERELDACLRGVGYGGQPTASAPTVRRWLAEGSCEGFARAAFRSRECFVLQIVLEEAGFPLSPPRSAPPAAKSGRLRPTGPAPVPADGFYRASHILIFYAGAHRAPAAVHRSKADALRLATSLTRLARAGTDFAGLARRFSECSSAARGGDLGRFQLDKMVPPFSAAVKDLHPGEIAGPVETAFGYHVIRRH